MHKIIGGVTSMYENYTIEMNNSLSEFYGYEGDDEQLQFYDEQEEDDDEQEDKIKKFLLGKKWRPFGAGLTIVLKKSGYSGDEDDIDEKTNYLFDQLKEIGESICKKTVKSWFENEKRPKIEHSSRERMYKICFALGLKIEDVYWFFNHVYFDRCFNYHEKEETVYSFCLRKGLSYKDARNIIQDIENKESYSKEEDESEVCVPFTEMVKDKVSEFESDKELIDFLVSNKKQFETNNQSAYGMICKYWEEIAQLQTKDTNGLRNKVKENGDVKKEDVEKCGLFTQELGLDAENGQDIKDKIEQRSLNSEKISRKFFLETMGIPDKKQNISCLFSNFPDEKIFSDLLDYKKISIMEPYKYDAIRKMLILLHFYSFWCHVKLEGACNCEQLREDYIEEANEILYSTGYSDLYAGNPYDWIVLYSARKKNPLESLRNLIGDLTDSVEDE